MSRDVRKKREWERANRNRRSARRRELRRTETAILEKRLQPDGRKNKRNREEALQQARLEGQLVPLRGRASRLRIDRGKVSVTVPGDAIGRALFRWLSK
jgi:hypothetical protein